MTVAAASGKATATARSTNSYATIAKVGSKASAPQTRDRPRDAEYCRHGGSCDRRVIGGGISSALDQYKQGDQGEQRRYPDLRQKPEPNRYGYSCQQPASEATHPSGRDAINDKISTAWCSDSAAGRNDAMSQQHQLPPSACVR
jgi:hypothetical protein